MNRSRANLMRSRRYNPWYGKFLKAKKISLLPYPHRQLGLHLAVPSQSAASIAMKKVILSGNVQSGEVLFDVLSAVDGAIGQSHVEMSDKTAQARY